MVDFEGYWFHFRTHKKYYITFGLQFILFLLGIILMAVGDHESRSTMFSLGVLCLMSSIIWFGVYIAIILCCPDRNFCCEQPEWERFGDEEEGQTNYGNL